MIIVVVAVVAVVVLFGIGVVAFFASGIRERRRTTSPQPRTPPMGPTHFGPHQPSR